MQSMDGAAVRQWLENEHPGYRRMNLDAVLGYAGLQAATAVGYAWGDGKGPSGEVYVRDDRLVLLALSNPNDAGTVGEIVAAMGDPEWVLLLATVRESAVYYFQLDYPGRGFSLVVEGTAQGMHLGSNAAPAIDLEPGMVARTVYCYLGGSMEHVLGADFLLSASSSSALLQARVPWAGFGPYLARTK
jgi:hypothetical protein